MSCEINKRGFYLFKVLLFTYIFIVFFIINQNKCFADSSFVDLLFHIGSTQYTSQSENKTVDLAPFIQHNTTLIPFRTILEELGYSVQWDKRSKTITASNESTTIILKINSIYAEVNGETRILAVAPKIVSERTVVPLRFVSECSGAFVSWDEEEKTIHITQYGKFDTGKVLYNEKKNNQNTLYTYDGNGINSISLENKDIQNWYTFKGQVFLTVSEQGKENKGLYLLRGNDLQLLLEHFEMKDSFEYNDNLVILGYDRVKQYDILCRFDGKSFYVVKDNFFVGKRFIFKDKMVISKYDNNRRYSVVVIDKTSWEPTVLKDGFIISDYAMDNNYVYIIGNEQEGIKKPLVIYDGNGVSSFSFKVVLDDANVDIRKVVMFQGRLFAVVDGVLCIVDDKVPIKIFFQDIGAKVRYAASFIQVFNNKLYLGTAPNAYFYNEDYVSINKPGHFIEQKGGIVEIFNVANSEIDIINANSYITINLGTYRKLIQKFEPMEIRIEENILMAWGKDSDTFDMILYTYDGSTVNRMVDIVKINNIISAGGKTFLDVRDKNRLDGTERNTIIIQDGLAISNLVVGFETKRWSDLNGSLIFTGYESSGQRNKVYSLKSEFIEQLGNFDADYWQKFGDNLFISGLNKENGSSQLYKFKDENSLFLKDNIKVLNIIKAKGPYYFIDAVDKDPNSKTLESRILLIYDDVSRDFYRVKAGLQITGMLYVQ
ncbi:copper amine oxidase N-terminal domain-containing protein [Pseudobacteroides cellulosolvens]|nr:copper amine oxidase N-terminal domain-containing protein [Pseudobacteroides cellulosolvens]